MQLVKPGEALITDTSCATSVSFFGELICTYLQRKGVEAVVTDAGICDIFDVAATGLTVFSACGSVASDGSMVVCEHSCPINFCGVAVYHGDVLVGDMNGVVVVPRNLAAEVAKKAVRLLPRVFRARLYSPDGGSANKQHLVCDCSCNFLSSMVQRAAIMPRPPWGCTEHRQS
jgi:regulator of RNase E activity RraA